MSKIEKDNRFQPSKHTKEEDLPNILHAKGDKFSIDVSEVKESFTWFINMADFLKTTELKCKDCALYPGCGRYPKSDQKIGFCFEEKTTKKRGYCFDCRHEIEVDLVSESCPLCGSDNWNIPLKQKEVIK